MYISTLQLISDKVADRLDALETGQADSNESMDTAWIIFSATLVFLMQVQPDPDDLPQPRYTAAICIPPIEFLTCRFRERVKYAELNGLFKMDCGHFQTHKFINFDR